MVNTSKHSEGLEEINREDLFMIPFENSVPLQTGKFLVVANYLDENGEVMGGGAVANFETREDADRCFDKLLAMDPAHKPELLSMDWSTTEGEVIRSLESNEAAKEMRKKAAAAFAEGRIVKRKRKDK